MTLTADRIWLISAALLALVLAGLVFYEGSIFSLILFSMGFLLTVSAIGVILLIFWRCRVGSRVMFAVAISLCAAASVFGTYAARQGTYYGSDPANDFKRFVMNGPHWPDQDTPGKDNPTDGYDPSAHPLPESVHVLRSKTFGNFDAEGAAVYFQADPKDVDDLIASNTLTPTTDAHDLAKFNRWTAWSLWETSRDLGPNPTFYLRKSDGFIETWMMATSQDHKHALFLFLNEN